MSKKRTAAMYLIGLMMVPVLINLPRLGWIGGVFLAVSLLTIVILFFTGI